MKTAECKVSEVSLEETDLFFSRQPLWMALSGGKTALGSASLKPDVFELCASFKALEINGGESLFLVSTEKLQLASYRYRKFLKSAA